jgi:epoxyqueuosine reductase
VKNLIEQRALELGFDACHFTTAAAPESAGKFQRWLDEGRHGAMAYLARNASRRIDPQQVLPGARSIITLASAYSGDDRRNTPHSPHATGHHAPRNTQHETRNSGLIARYAQFADYHDVLAAPLKQLSDFVTGLGGAGARSLWYVDTGPLLERDLAQRAGLGFIGKHTNLISRRLGNWLLLSEIITTLELAPDAPEKNRCGSCVRCLAACPTQAITAPFQLDARRCISYLTIELKGSIPIELRPAIGNRIYGCDDCLEACPWNKFAREGQLMKPHARPDLATPDLIELLSLDEAGFKRRFAGTPMLRTKRRGLLRNVCVALGNVGDDSALPALRRATGDPEPLIAEHARWAVECVEARRSESRI